MVDALISKVMFLTTMETVVIRFEFIKDLYEATDDFGHVVEQYKNHVGGTSNPIFVEYIMQYGYLIKVK